MNSAIIKQLVIAAALAVSASASAKAQVFITEVAPWGSSSSYAADWFEVKNTGASALDITGWKMDDNSNLFTSSVAIRGLTSIAAGQSVVFLDGGATSVNDTTLGNNFKTAWFGSSVPSGFTLGFYGGTGVGLSTSGDAVNLYNSGGTLQANVTFGANAFATPPATSKTFDNIAGLNNAAVSMLSVVGVNDAFTSFDATAVGSPGNVSAVPEPSEYAAVFGVFALGAAVWIRRQRR